MVTLRDYQNRIASDAVSILNEYGLVYLAMEVRTGKTLTALSILDRIGSERALFVTKKKAIASIQSDCVALGIDSYLYVINYESLHKLTDTFDTIIIDEAHRIGSYPKQCKSLKELRRIAANKPRLIYLSGTPTPESYSQLFNQFQVVPERNPLRFTTFYKFAKEWVNVISKNYGYSGGSVNDYSDCKPEVLDIYSKVMISYTQKEAGFEANIVEHVVEVDMLSMTYKMIERLRTDRVIEGKNGVILADTNVKLQNKIHQLCSGSIILEDGKAIKFDYSKCTKIYQLFSGKKIAIFTKFQAEKDMLVEFLGANGQAVTDSPEKYQECTECWYVGQIQASREGVNLSASEALVYYNIDFSALSYLQGRDRATSKDRVGAIDVYWIFAKGGIESKIYKAVRNKENYTNKHFKRDYK